jgi:hypothetical protein
VSFYVTIRRGRRSGLLAGPFRTHGQAAAHVDATRALAVQVDPWAHFDEVGTGRSRTGSRGPGRLNARLGLPVDGRMIGSLP